MSMRWQFMTLGHVCRLDCKSKGTYDSYSLHHDLNIILWL